MTQFHILFALGVFVLGWAAFFVLKSRRRGLAFGEYKRKFYGIAGTGAAVILFARVMRSSLADAKVSIVYLLIFFAAWIILVLVRRKKK
ncbi:MAG: hypothetical protein LBS64_04260 [Spirochaetaceae bacterium]|jgi:hypothetical protein|nr:hypothetical protein [Spirochaetaceae bacterium]